MKMSRAGAAGRGALENIADGLAQDADSFTPDVESAPRSLPGRRRGAALSHGARPPAGPAAAVILDIGTSRRDGFTHVLWVSPQAETLLGSRGIKTLDEQIAALEDVASTSWEGDDHLHLRAPRREHHDLLREVRALVGRLVA